MRVLALALLALLAGCAKPQMGWHATSEREFTLMPLGERNGIQWNVIGAAGAQIRFDVSAEADVLFTAERCQSAGARFSALCEFSRSPASVTVRDNRPMDATALASAMVSSTARDKLAAPNRVRVVMYEWSCIAHCSR